MFKKLSACSVIVLFAAFLWFFSPFEIQQDQTEKTSTIKGTIVSVLEEREDFQTFQIELENGKKLIVENDESMAVSPREFTVGDKIILTESQIANGEITYYISDYFRQNILIILFVIFVVAVVIVTRWQGLRSLFGMALSFVILFKLVLPLILRGYDPLLVAIFGSIFIIPITFYLSHGFNRKTTTAIIGTLITLVVTGIIAKIFADIGNLTGLAQEEAGYLKLETREKIDFSSLVLAGMVITMLGILDDVTISQSSVVQQLRAVKQKIHFSELFKRAMQVGRDHISSLVNTLILVYAGASLPMLLLFLDHSESFLSIVNLEFMAQEIIQTFVGSIGLILAIPITTFIAIFTVKGEVEADGHKHG